MVQLAYNKDPAVAIQGQLAEPMAPMRIISRLVETAAIAPGLAVSAGTDATKQVVISADANSVVGIAVLQDYIENKPTGVVDADTGEIMTTATYPVGKQLGVMCEGTVWCLVAAAGLTTPVIGEELDATAAGDFVRSAGANTSAYKCFLDDVSKTGNLAAGDLIKVRIQGPQGA